MAIGVLAVRLDESCSRYFRWRHLFHAGETFARLSEAGTAPPNVPTEPASWEAYAQLARLLLDPIFETFGAPVLTYGFASPALTRSIPGRIAPQLDQHAAHEQRNGRPICARGGAAVDLWIPGRESSALARWIVQHLPFDRLYCYGAGRPLHLSHGPAPAGQIVRMAPGPSGRLIPRRIGRDRV